MPLEPNQNMDDLLKAYAKERREQAGAPLELHSADRKALQDEVARKFGRADRSRWSLLAGLWPRLALAGIVAVAGTMLLVWHGGFKAPQTTELAKQDVAAPAVPQGRVQPQGVEMAAPLHVAKKSEALNSPMQLAPNPTVTGDLSSQRETLTSQGAPGTKQEEKSLGWQDQSAVDNLALQDNKSRSFSEEKGVQNIERSDRGEVFASRGAVDTVPETKGKRDTRIGMGAPARQRSIHGGGGGGGGIALSEVSQTTGSLSGASVSVAPASRPSEADLQMRFQQIDNRAKYRQNLLSPPVPKVLVSFELQRNGQNVRIVDADGSVYEGKVIQAAGNSFSNDKAYLNNQYSNNQLKASDADALTNSSGYLAATAQAGNAQSPFQNEPSFSFSVKGYNKAIKQGIAFTGSYIPEAYSLSNATALQKNVTSNLQGARNLPQQQSMQNSVINGRVEVGNVTEFPLDANSLPPTGTPQQQR